MIINEYDRRFRIHTPGFPIHFGEVDPILTDQVLDAFQLLQGWIGIQRDNPGVGQGLSNEPRPVSLEGPTFNDRFWCVGLTCCNV